MNEVLKLIKEAGVAFLATSEDGQPKLRPIGSIGEIDGKMYMFTSDESGKFAQMQKNKKVAVSCMANHRWLVLEGEIVVAPNEALSEQVFNSLDSSAKAIFENGNLTPMCFENVSAVINEFGKEPVTYKF